jgi:hypothetical protein
MREVVIRDYKPDRSLTRIYADGGAAPESEGSRIRGIPPEDWETVYRAYHRKDVSGRGSLLVRQDPDFFQHRGC